MTRFAHNQYITFAIDTGAARRFDSYRYIRTTKARNTINKIAAFYGHTEDARFIGDLNGITNLDRKLKRGRQLKVPGEVRADTAFRVLCGEASPQPSGGYAQIDTVNRPQRVGVSVFTGYGPTTFTVPIRFENFIEGEGADIEQDILLLEGMAGRGIKSQRHGSGAPPLIRISVTAADGNPVPLISYNYQFKPKVNTNAPLWYISDIDWDDSPERNPSGNRIRQLATVTLIEHVEAQIKSLSATQRARSR